MATHKHAKKFIATAIKHPGALTRKAHAAGESVSQYAKSHVHAKGQAGKQARFYEYVLKKVHH